MKQFISLFVVAVALSIAMATPAMSQQEVPAVLTQDDSLPILRSVMLDPSNHPVAFGSGAFFDIFTELSLDLSGPTRQRPASISTNVNWSFQGNADVRRSNSGGSGLFKNIPLEVIIRIAPGSAGGGVQVYDTEMLYLNIAGGGLPPGVMIRESPTRASLGKHTIKPVSGGRFMVDSFFDVFLELSTDGGQNWMPADGSVRIEAKIKPTILINRPDPPPMNAGRYIADLDRDGLDDLVLALETSSSSVPIGTTSRQQMTFGFVYWTDPLTRRIANPGVVEIDVTHTFDEGGTQYFDTEMLSLDIRGGALPTGMMIRESPTLPSRGKTSISGAIGEGASDVSSFFDVFTELSIDGGQTWTPQPPATLEFREPLHPEVPLVVAVDNGLPVQGSVLVDPSNHPVTFNSFFDIFTEVSIDFGGTPKVKPPLPGASLDKPMTGTARFHLSLDGGTTVQVHTCPVDATMRVTSSSSSGDTRTFDTEMLSMSLSGGSLNPPIRIRESPTLPSLGKMHIRESPTRRTGIASFFDVFFEISVDGGQTWSPADDAMRLETKILRAPVPSPVASVMPPGTFHAQPIGDPDFDLLRLNNNSLPAIQAPPPGSSSTSTIVVRGSLMVNGGSLSVDDASLTLTATGRFSDGTTSTFDTEMLQLDISGGTLPTNMKIRESPSKASLGRSSIQTLPGGQREVSSFFDVFLDLSLDGGQTWTPQAPTTLEFADTVRQRESPSLGACLPVATYPDDLYPPIGLRMSPPGAPPVQFPNSMRAKGIIITKGGGGSGARALPPLGVSDTYVNNEECDVQISMGAGQPFQDVHLTGPSSVLIHHSSDNGSTRTFDTEMLSLDLVGGGGAFRLRESPTRQSLGRHTVKPNGSGYAIDSFFDIFIEVSLDGGQTWNPTAEPMHVEQQLLSPEHVFATSNFPPPGVYKGVEPEDCDDRSEDIVFPNGARVFRPAFFDVFADVALPPPGGSSTNPATARSHMEVSLDGGNSFFDVFTEVSMSTRVTSTNNTPTTRFFETEMLSLSLTGGGIMLRESPTKQSLGKTTLRESPTRISSFFDVFFELSIDGGQTWSPALSSMRIELDSVRSGVITGMKWHDVDGNGVKNGAEAGIANWKIYLTDSSFTPMDSVLTDVGGNYAFLNVAPGTYRVFEQWQSGWMQTGGAPIYGFWMVPGDTNRGNDFGNFQAPGITGMKFNDHNGNGVRDAGDEGLRDWEICLFPKNIPNPGVSVNGGTGSLSMQLNGLSPGQPVIVSGFAASRKGYEYYKAAGDMARVSRFENGQIPTEMLALDLHSANPVVIGGNPYFVIIKKDTSKPTKKEYVGHVTLLKTRTRPNGADNHSPLTTSFFDIFVELQMMPLTPLSTNPVPRRLFCELPMQAALNEFGEPDPLMPGMVYGGGSVKLYDDLGVEVGTLDSLTFEVGPSASQVNPICTKTDSSGKYSFSPMLPGVWNVIERPQPCWDQTTPIPPPIEIVSTPSSACASPDNGSGTADLPALCAYKGGKMRIVDGLPAGTTTESDASFSGFSSITRSPGGSLGGERDVFNATIMLEMKGTGSLAGYNRVFSILLNNNSIMDHAPRTPGAPVQSFDSEIMDLGGQIVGDPDFDLLRITGGTSNGMPSPGHTTLTRNGASWTVDSFFDITYRIDFIGKPGSVFAGRSGSTTGTIRWSQGGSAIPPVDFGNHYRGGSIWVTKYNDVNHNQTWENDLWNGQLKEPPMPGVSFVLSQLGTSATYNAVTDASGRACFNELPPGEYQLTEVLPAGYAYSLPKSGFMDFVIGGCEDTSVVWLNTLQYTDSLYRTATYREWATAVDPKNKRKEIKCKPDKVKFKFQLTVPTPGAIQENLIAEFSMDVIGAITINGKQDTLQTFGPGKKFMFVFSPPLAAGTVIQFDGIGNKGKLMKAKYAFGLRRKVDVTPYVYNQPLLPMPTLVNVLEDLFDQGAFPFTIGAAADSHSVLQNKPADVLKSLAKDNKGTLVYHDSTVIRCLDIYNNKPIRKQIKSMSPDKGHNAAYAEVLTLRLNILASQHRKFPVGLDSLIWDNHKDIGNPTDPTLDGKTVGDIFMQANALMACKQNPKGLTVPLDEYIRVIKMINRAFAGPVDTIRWNCQKLLLKGVRPLKQVTYLRANPNYVPPPFAGVETPRSASRLPGEFALDQNYPNPFNPTTQIAFELSEASIVSLKIYNMIGQEVGTLIDNQYFDEGAEEVEFDATALPSGVYLYRITAQVVEDDETGALGQIHTAVRKMVLVK